MINQAQYLKYMHASQFANWEAFESHVLTSSGLAFEKFIELAFRTQNLSQAFALGYHYAIQQLAPNLPTSQWAAMCVTEPTGQHPKELRTLVTEQGVVNGYKSFITHGSKAGLLIVIARLPESEIDIKSQLRAVLVVTQENGPSFKRNAPLGILPDVYHGEASFENVQGKLMPGDGHSDYSKPFRLIEDQCMVLSFTSHVLSKAHQLNLSQSLQGQCLALLRDMYEVKVNLDAVETISLNDKHQRFQKIAKLFESELDKNSAYGKQWCVDKKIFELADSARQARLNKAWKNLKQQ
ncbi:acyl-CoA dehydrogenase family protein [Bermanella sp. R86510]|uniref:acyl-CoA dehydrogenase family protein n=1 Tax=unclassified Bermanella TaxID=2627862 RepID=UPI0037C96EAE